MAVVWLVFISAQTNSLDLCELCTKLPFVQINNFTWGNLCGELWSIALTNRYLKVQRKNTCLKWFDSIRLDMMVVPSTWHSAFSSTFHVPMFIRSDREAKSEFRFCECTYRFVQSYFYRSIGCMFKFNQHSFQTNKILIIIHNQNSLEYFVQYINIQKYRQIES